MTPLKILEEPSPDPGLWRRIRHDFAGALERFRDFERVYAAIRGRGKSYLEERARDYRREVDRLQDLIESPVRSQCGTCRSMCCRLAHPERSIYLAGSVGGFTLVDYLLARCGGELPEARFESVDENLCPYWDLGCRLPRNRRSLVCLRYFCDELVSQVDREQVTETLERIEALLASFSMAACLELGEEDPGGEGPA